MQEPYLLMTPGPTNVPPEVLEALSTPLINHRDDEFRELLEAINSKLRQVFQTQGQIVIITGSGTAGVDAAIQAVVRPGDRVVVTNFGEFGSRAVDFAKANGASVHEISAPPGLVPRLDDILEEIEKGVATVVLVANETSTGVRLPYIEKIAREARRMGSFVIVDAVSYIGGDYRPVDDWGIDICVTASQKCLAAPPGLALLSISKRIQEFLENNAPRDGFLNLVKYLKFSQRGQTPFTPAISLLFALNVALDIVLEEGLDNRISRHRICANAFYRSLAAVGLNSMAEGEIRSNTVLAIKNPPGLHDTEFRNILKKKHRILVADGFGELKGKVFRIGSMGMVNKQIVLRTVSAIAKTLSEMNYTVNLREALNEVDRAFNLKQDSLLEAQK